MTVIPAVRLSPSDLACLGHNVGPAVRRDREELAAVNRSLAVHGEQLDPEEPAAKPAIAPARR